MAKLAPGNRAGGLAGQVALVTGGARRVGAAIVRALAADGAAVAIHHHRSAEEAVALAAELGGPTIAVAADLRAPAQIEGLLAEVERRLGPVQLLVNNASLFVRTPVEELTAERWDEIQAVGLRAPLLCLRAALPGMRRLGGGQVVNLADLAGQQAWVGYAAHVAAKAGLIALTRSLARELAPTVRVNAVVPGLVLADAGLDAATQQLLASRIPQGTTGTPEDVAAAVRFLLGCRALTGVVLPVDGGRGAGRAVTWPTSAEPAGGER